ncbi:MAG: dihydropyrimidine dehydrogenase [Firmicutes bacterium HGW-Firmicutes-11]|nr:MAG: dihydropyrimidine dehydrogenase [Firmicutes bacterium HGW-Firmicutes-11]
MSKVEKKKFTDESDKQYGYNLRTAREEALRCLLCEDAPCSKGCPAGTDPGSFIKSIRFNNVKGAAETIRSNNILGGTCARVCPYDRLCEEYCSRCGIDKPIQIGRLQRFAVEQEKAFKMKVLEAPQKKKAGKVACIGAGPASLACAAKLATNGYKVTIYDEQEKPGGVLSYGITPSRLPEAVVEHDIKQVKNLGVKFVQNTKVGKDVDLAEMDYDAVFVGVGLWGTHLPAIPGIDKKGVWTAIDFLKEARTKKDAFKPGDNVVVVGGGDVAVDCATSAKLLGAKNVSIVYRRTIEEAPANMMEFKYALNLGIGMTTNMAPAEVLGKTKVESVAFNGRDGVSGLKIKADAVVFAIGQKPEDMDKLAGLKVTEKGFIKAGKNGKTNVTKVFAAGDIVNGGKTVVEAVAAGKEAADSIMAYLAKKEGVK